MEDSCVQPRFWCSDVDWTMWGVSQNLWPILSTYVISKLNVRTFKQAFVFTLHCITLHCVMLHYVMLRYITSRCVTLRYITLHYVTLRYFLSNRADFGDWIFYAMDEEFGGNNLDNMLPIFDTLHHNEQSKQSINACQTCLSQYTLLRNMRRRIEKMDGLKFVTRWVTWFIRLMIGCCNYCLVDAVLSMTYKDGNRYVLVYRAGLRS